MIYCFGVLKCDLVVEEVSLNRITAQWCWNWKPQSQSCRKVKVSAE